MSWILRAFKGHGWRESPIFSHLPAAPLSPNPPSTTTVTVSVGELTESVNAAHIGGSVLSPRWLRQLHLAPGRASADLGWRGIQESWCFGGTTLSLSTTYLVSECAGPAGSPAAAPIRPDLAQGWNSTFSEFFFEGSPGGWIRARLIKSTTYPKYLT